MICIEKFELLYCYLCKICCDDWFIVIDVIIIFNCKYKYVNMLVNVDGLVFCGIWLKCIRYGIVNNKMVKIKEDKFY